jgi:putative transposase
MTRWLAQLWAIGTHIWRWLMRWWHRPARERRLHIQRQVLPASRVFAPPKPKWVKQEVIRLKALMPQAGCRTIAHHFNRRWRQRKHMTVSKTYVADLCRRHQYLIYEARRKLKHRIPRPMRRNRVWGCDLLTKTDQRGQPHLALAILDHASRACVRLQRLSNKSSWALLRELVEAVKHYGQPRFLRTDNEAVLVSRLFRLGLWLLGIR